MENNDSNKIEFEDISSSTKQGKKDKNIYVEFAKDVGDHLDKYGNGIFKHMGGIIKFIAFVLCFAIIIAAFVAAFFLFTNTTFSKIISFAIIGAGAVVGLLVLFLISGMGHIICQNNAILTKLNRLQKKE